MNKFWKSCKQIVNKSWWIHEQVGNIFGKSCEQVLTSHEQVWKNYEQVEQLVNKLWISHKRFMNKLWTSFNKLWTSPGKVMNKLWFFWQSCEQVLTNHEQEF